MVEIDERTKKRIKEVLYDGEDVDDFIFNLIEKEIEKRQSKFAMEDRLPETTYIPIDIEEYIGKLRHELEMERSRNRRLSEQVSILYHQLEELRIAYESQRNQLNLYDATLSSAIGEMNRFAKHIAEISTNTIANQITVESSEKMSRIYEDAREKLSERLKKELSMDDIEKITHVMLNIFEQYKHLEKTGKQDAGKGK